MESFFLDTSALIKRYVEEEGTPRIVGLFGLPVRLDGRALMILDLALLESRSAVRRREREGDMTPVDAARILKQIEEDAASSCLVQPSTAAVIEDAARLIDRHPLKAYDALQLSGCLMARRRTPTPVTFVCADTRLCDAARDEGLAVMNPLDS